MKLKTSTKTNIIFAIYSIIFLSLIIAINNLSRMGLGVLNGCLSALQYGICLLCLGRDSKRGVNIAFVLMGINILIMLMGLIASKNTAVLPGLANAIFYVITVAIVAVYNRKREWESITDILTGIYNRRGLYRILREKIDKNKPFHLIYLTIDNFKVINDNYGHQYGDELMRLVSKRMADTLGKDVILARLVGTDFVAVVDGKADAKVTADSVLEAIREKAILNINDTEVECYLQCYAGISTFPNDSTEYEALIKYADIAMYEASVHKSKSVYSFAPVMAEEMNKQIEIEKLIKVALEKDYFYMVYQPQFKMDGKTLKGFESLIRLKDEEGNFVSPGVFIPIAEKGEQILQIDDYVLRRTMNEFKDIVKARPEITISINVSAKNIGKVGFAKKIETLLAEIDFPASNLEIEITEYCMVDSLDITTENIMLLKKMGVLIALDDFGTGYTSLNYVSTLPIDLLKIDKSLIDDIESNDTRREFVHTIISMGHLMDCEVISEGVEKEEQVAYLKADGCDYVQGYVWGKPMAYEDAKELSYRK